MVKYIPLFVVTLIMLVGFEVQTNQKSSNARAFYECSDPIDIDSNVFIPRKGKVYFHFDTKTSPSAEKFTEFIWYDDKQPSDYFAAYLVNTSDSSFYAERQDGSLIMIQEALDEEGKWRPIEYWVYSGCGNSYFDPLELESGKCVLVPIKIYTGKLKTKIRLRFKQGKTLYCSESFDAKINPSQFEKETENVHGILYHGKANYLESANSPELIELK